MSRRKVGPKRALKEREPKPYHEVGVDTPQQLQGDAAGSVALSAQQSGFGMPIPADALIRKLRAENRLEPGDLRALESLPIIAKRLGPSERIVKDGDRPTKSCLLVHGYLFRSKITDGGERQILSLHIPGEIPDLQSLHLHVMDHDLSALTESVVGYIDHSDLRNLNKDYPNVAAALWRETLIDAAIFREWIVNLGRRAALPRMAHLICEMRQRLDMIGQAQNDAFELWITQAELADCVGMTSVHANRVIQELRNERLIEIDRKHVRVLDREELERVGQFNKLYLHQRPSL